MDTNHSTVAKQGILKKVKPKQKSKYFVLHRDGRDQPARLEYYDSLKNWEARKKPKKAIPLKACFSVNEFANSKVEYGMALYTKDDCFQVGFDNESERDSWLQMIRALYTLHRDSRPFFEHVWNVKIRERGLGKGYEGEYRLCLKDRNVMFFKKMAVEETLAFPLEVIRHCGHTDNFFKLEVGRQAVTGPGEFWLEVDDELIASNVHQTLITVMNAPKDEDMFRPSSSSMSSKDRSSLKKGSTVNKSDTVSSKAGSTRGKSVSGTSGHSAGSDRHKNGPIMRSTASMKSERNRSDSIDSKSTLSSRQPSVSYTSIPAGSQRSIDNIPPSASLGDSRGSTPVRSLTPELKVSTLAEHDASQIPSYMDMSPFGPQANIPRSSSISSSSVHSWVSSKDVLDGSGAARCLVGLNASSGIHNDMGSSHQGPLTSQTVAARLSVGKRPERTQSYFSQTDDHADACTGKTTDADDSPYFDMLPQASYEESGNDAYFDMVPIATKEPSPSFKEHSTSESYFEMAPVAKAKSLAADHLSADTRLIASDTVGNADPYMDMMPVGSVPEKSLLYVDMAPSSSLDKADVDWHAEMAGDSYVDMVPACQSKDCLQVDMTSPFVSSSAGNIDSGYLDMTPAAMGQPSLADTSYIDMTSSDGKGLRQDFAGLSWEPYIDMTGKKARGCSQDGLRLEDVERPPLRHYSVGSRPTARRRELAQKDHYVEMCPSTDMTAKSRSVPHLMPLSLASNPDLTHLQEEYPSNHPSKAETLVMMSIDKSCASNESLKQRPRGNTWSSPRPSLHSQKSRLSTKSNSSRESLHSTCSDYIDMQMGSRSRDSEYVEMGARSVRHNRKHSHPMDTTKQSISAKFKSKLSPPKPSRSGGSSPSTLGASLKSSSHDTLSDRLNQSEYVGFMPDEVQRNPSLSMIGRRMSQPHQRIEPFPELSNSSEEETGMRSAASSFSSTRSSSSSRSSLARSDTASLKNSVLFGGGSQVDPDSYLDCQSVVVRGSPGSGPHTAHSSSIQPKSTRVRSFISDEPSETPTPKGKTTKVGKEQRVDAIQSYVDMVPVSKTSAKTRLKQSLPGQLPAQANPTLPQPSQQPTKVSPEASTSLHKPHPKKPANSVSKTRLSSPTQPAPTKATTDKFSSPHPRSSETISHHFQLSKPPPLNQSLPLPSQHITAASYALMGPQTDSDPYLMMDPPSRADASRKPNAVDEKLQSRLMVDVVESSGAPYSEMAFKSASTGTGSSGDSNHTLQLEEIAIEDCKPSLMDSPYSLYSKPLKIPKAPPCYIRQHSDDISIYPSPSIPAACYIRSDSNLSRNSDFDSISPLNSRETQDAIFDSLANAQPEDLSAMLRQGASSPCRFPSTSGNTTSSNSRCNSDSSDIPGSAAELERQQKKKLELVQEEKESCGSKEGSAESFTGSASSGKEIAGQVPAKCYIREDPKPSKTRAKVPSAPAPALPVRGISSDEKALRLSAGAETTEALPLNYVAIKHDDALVTSPPSNTGGMTSAAALARTPDGAIVAALATVNSGSDVNYTTIDIEKTLELGKKTAAGLLPL